MAVAMTDVTSLFLSVMATATTAAIRNINDVTVRKTTMAGAMNLSPLGSKGGNDRYVMAIFSAYLLTTRIIIKACGGDYWW